MENKMRKIAKEEVDIFLVNLSKSFDVATQDSMSTVVETPIGAYHWAISYPRHKEKMKEIVINTQSANNVIAALNWAKNIGDIEEMGDIVASSNSYKSKALWGQHFGSPPQKL